MDLLLGIDVFVEVMMHGQQTGIPGSLQNFTWLGFSLGNQDVRSSRTTLLPYMPPSYQMMTSYRSSGKSRSVSRVHRSCLLKSVTSSNTSMTTTHILLMEDSSFPCSGNPKLAFLDRAGHQQFDAFSHLNVHYMKEVNLMSSPRS